MSLLHSKQCDGCALLWLGCVGLDVNSITCYVQCFAQLPKHLDVYIERTQPPCWLKAPGTLQTLLACMHVEELC